MGLQSVGIRFNALSIPPGATITNAYIEFTVKEVHSEATSLVIRVQAADNPLTFSSTASDISNRARTGASVAWDDLPVWSTLNATQVTPNLSAVLQEVVNRPGWASGNSLVVFIDGSGRRTVYAYDGGSTKAALLHIEYITTAATPAPTMSIPPTGTATVTSTPTPTVIGGSINSSVQLAAFHLPRLQLLPGYDHGATTWTKYYFAGTSRVASRTCRGVSCSPPSYYLSDHLGSTTMTVDAEQHVRAGACKTWCFPMTRWGTSHKL
jgi:hypothetical protein